MTSLDSRLFAQNDGGKSPGWGDKSPPKSLPKKP
jgi:hypothetical protein